MRETVDDNGELKMGESELIKTVPLKRILVIKAMQIRPIDRGHVELLKGCYEEEEKTGTVTIPPVVSYLLQSGDPDTAIYPLADGIHRYTAQKELKRKFIRIIVQTEQTFTVDDTESKSLHCELTISGMCLNAKNPQAFTPNQREAVVIKCYCEYNVSIEKIVQTGIAARSTIYKWLKPFTENKREAKSLLTEKILELRNIGNSEREITRVLQKDKDFTAIIPKSLDSQKMMVHRVLKKSSERGGTFVQIGQMYHPENPISETHSVTPTLPPYQVYSNEPGIEEAVYVENTMSKLFNIIQNTSHSEHLEDRLRLQFLPLLRNFCPTIDHFCSDQGDFTEISGLRADYYALHDQIKLKNRKIVDLEDEKTALVAQLAEKTNNCHEDCPHTYARLRIEKNRFHNFILARAKQFADLMPHHSPDTQKIIKNLAFEFILPAISMFESSAEHGANLTTSDTISQFAEFDNLLKSSHLTNQLINKRLQQLRSSFEALGSMQSCQNNKMQVTS